MYVRFAFAFSSSKQGQVKGSIVKKVTIGNEIVAKLI